LQIRPRLQERVYDRIRVQFGGTPPLPQFMTEGDWIAMPGIPLITAGGPEAAAREEGEATGVPDDEAGAAEDTTAPTTEEGHGEGAAEPATEGERAEAADGTAPFVPAGLEAAPVAEEELAPAHGDVVAAAVPVEEDAAADASEAAHAAELEAALLAASSPGGEGPAEPAVDAAVASVEAPEASAVLSEAPVVTEGAEV
jgi:hypothetical protein